MRLLGSFLRGCDALVRVLAGISLLVIAAVLFANAVARYFANFNVIGSEELSRYLMVWITFLGSYLLVRVQRHITVDVFFRLVPQSVVKVVSICCAIVGAITMSYVAWLGYELTAFIFRSGQMSSSLPVLRGWIYLAIPVGCGLTAVAYVYELLVMAFGGTLPKAADYGLPDDVPDVDDAAIEKTA